MAENAAKVFFRHECCYEILLLLLREIYTMFPQNVVAESVGEEAVLGIRMLAPDQIDALAYTSKTPKEPPHTKCGALVELTYLYKLYFTRLIGYLVGIRSSIIQLGGSYTTDPRFYQVPFRIFSVLFQTLREACWQSPLPLIEDTLSMIDVVEGCT